MVMSEQVRTILCQLLRKSVFISISHSLRRRLLFDGEDPASRHIMIFTALAHVIRYHCITSLHG